MSTHRHVYPKKWIVFFLQVFSVIPVLAQFSPGLNKDSIKAIVKKMPVDTNKVLTYIALGQQYEENQPDSAVYYYHQAKVLSEQLGYTAGIIKYISNYTAVLNMQGRFDESLKLNLQAVDLSRRTGSRKQLLAAYTNVGAVYQHKDNKPAALEWYLKALPLLEEDGNQQNLGIFFGNLCSLYDEMQQYDKAIAAGKRSLETGVKIKDLYIEGMAANNLGQVYIKLDQMPMAYRYMQRTYRVARLMPSLYYELSALLGLGTVYMRKQMPEKYVPLFQQALPLADSLDDAKGKVHALTGIGLGYYFTRRFAQAEEMFNQSINLARRFDFKSSLKEALLHLSDLYIAQGRLEEGETMRNSFDSIENELMNEMVIRNVQEIESRYQVQKHETALLQKNLQIEKSRIETSRQHNWLMLSLVGLVLLVALIVFIYRYYSQKLQLEKKEIESMKTAQENIRLKALVEGQMQERQRISQEMHDDMGSALTSILFLTHSLNKPSADTNTAQTTEKLKNTASGLIEKMNEIIWMLNDKYDSLQDLLAYMRVNLGEMVDNAGMDFRFLIPPLIPELHLSQKHRRNIYLIVKEAVHNVVKHAGATTVTIEVNFDNGLTITVSDDGKGMDVNSVRKFSNGLRNMHDRAEQIQGKITVHSEQGTRLELKLGVRAA